MTISELYELKSTFYKEWEYNGLEECGGFTAVEWFVDHLANWIYKNEERRTED